MSDIYIPKDLLLNKENMEAVYKLIEKYFSTDVIFVTHEGGYEDHEEQFFKELEKLNEPKVYEYLKNI